MTHTFRTFSSPSLDRRTKLQDLLVLMSSHLTICGIPSHQINDWAYEATKRSAINARIKFLEKEMYPLLKNLSEHLQYIQSAKLLKVDNHKLRSYTEPVLKCWKNRPKTDLKVI